MNNVLFQTFQSYNELDLLRNEGFGQGSGLPEIAFIFIFITPQKMKFFLSFEWSLFKNWLVWRVRPQIRSEREDKYLRKLLVLS